MTREAEWGTAVLAGLAVAGCWAVPLATAKPGTFAQASILVLFWLITATPGVFAVKVLLAAGRPPAEPTVSPVSTVDGPVRLLSAAAAVTPERCRDWAAAMAAELGHVHGRAARWRFAAGCARTAVFPRADGRAAAVALAVLAAAAVAAAAVPAMRLFAVTFVALVGVAATLAVARRQWHPPGPVAATVGVAGVAGATAITASMVASHPSAAAAIGQPVLAVAFAVVLAGFGWLALVPPRGLAADRLARLLGTSAAVVLCAGFLLASRLPGKEASGMAPYLLLAPIPIFFGLSAVGAALGGTLRRGVRVAVWGAVLGTAWVFVLWLAESLHWARNEMGLLLDAEGGYEVGFNLYDGVLWVLLWLPVWGVPFGVLGAALGVVVGAACRRWARRLSSRAA
jgi:hypothetical protein